MGRFPDPRILHRTGADKINLTKGVSDRVVGLIKLQIHALRLKCYRSLS